MNQQMISRNNVTCAGSGQPMLFAHGFGCDQHMWRFLTPSFAGGYRTVAFDYVGSGGSDLRAYDPARYSTLDGYAQDVLDVCAALDLRDVIFVGHSVSAMIGALAAIREPARFAHLVMVCPSPCYVNHPPDYIGGFERADLAGLLDMMDRNDLGWASFLAPTVMGHPGQPELTAEVERSFCAADPAIARRFAEVTFFTDSRADLPHVPVPSLILQCSDDALVPVTVGEYTHRHLPHSTLRVMPASGHCPHMSHPQETAALIWDYLLASSPERGGEPARMARGRPD